MTSRRWQRWVRFGPRSVGHQAARRDVKFVSDCSQPQAPGELRAADGPFLMLDQPLLADLAGGECSKWRKIAILADDQFQIGRWANQHVIIEGKLGRFRSALVSPAIFIEITTIKKD